MSDQAQMKGIKGMAGQANMRNSLCLGSLWKPDTPFRVDFDQSLAVAPLW